MPFKPGNYRGLSVHPEVTMKQRYLWFFKFAYKRRAKRKKLQVTLTDEEFIKLVTSDCHYCGKSFKEEVRRVNKNLINMLTIDRKDPRKGYNIENCVPSCKQCNTIKMDMSYDEFKDKIKHIAKFLNLCL